MAKDYSTKIRESSRELSTKERIMLKDVSDAIKLDVATQNEALIIDPEMWAVLDVHNENARDDKDYTQYLIVDKNGDKYVTGSESFWRSFTDIVDEIADSDEAIEWSLKIYRRPSNNYAGKDFITCSII